MKRDMPTPQQLRAAHKELADWLKACRQWRKDNPRAKRTRAELLQEAATQPK
jgi:hypothetical protein